MPFDDPTSTHMDIDDGRPTTEESWRIIGTLLRPSNDPSNLVHLLKGIVHTPIGRKQILCLRGSEAEQFLTLLHKVINSENTRSDEFRNTIIRVMIELAKCSKRLPSTLCLSNIKYEAEPIGKGAFGTVHKGRWSRDGEEVTVAVKILQMNARQSNSDDTREKQFYEEALLWRQLNNKHILPFLGIYKYGPQLGLVSEFQKNSNLPQYLNESPKPDKYKLVMEATRGLIYLHDNGVIHRDLKGPNILIGDDGSAMLADFGYSRMKHDLSEFLSSNKDVGTLYYMSPEILEKGSVKASKSSDIWALGMVIYETFAGQVPFSGKHEGAVVTAITRGDLPRKPEYNTLLGFTDDLWLFLTESCWKRDPDHRPTANDCLGRLKQLSQRWAALEAASPERVVTARISMDRKYISSLPLKLYRKHGVEVEDWHTDFAVLRGPASAVKALKADFDNHMRNRAIVEELIIPLRLHKMFIGTGGDTVKRFEAKYSVKVQFHLSESVSIRGLRSDVIKAKEDLQQTMERHLLYDDIRYIDVQPDTIARVRSDRDIILSQTDLKSITPTQRGFSDVLELRGSKYALDKGENLIKELQKQLNEEVIVCLHENVSQIRPLIIGDKLSELMAKCNGPSDRKSQRHLVSLIPGENAIRLRGSPTFVRNFKGVLEDAAEQSREVIIGIAVPHRLHSDLRAKWFSGSFPQQTHTRIHFPGGSMEPVFVNNDPENLLELKGTDTKDIVRIYGTRKNCENGQKCLQSLFKSQKRAEQPIHFKKKYHHGVHNIVKKNLTFKELGIKVDFSDPPIVPLLPLLPSEADWRIFHRYDPEDNAQYTWYLNAPTEEAIQTGVGIITKAVQETAAASHIGLLRFPNSSRFGQIVGTGGERLQEIQAVSKTSIEVPKPGQGSTIMITGSNVNVEDAKDRILQVLRDRPSHRPVAPSTLF